MRNHHELIDFYRDYLKKNPDDVRGYLWLLDDLIDDGRTAEALMTIEELEQRDHSFRPLYYRALCAMKDGERERAEKLVERMEREHALDWCAAFSAGDWAVTAGDYDRAVACFRRAFELQPEPKYVDSFISIAHVEEIRGRTAEAKRAYEQALTVYREQWGMSAGEEIDEIREKLKTL